MTIAQVEQKRRQGVLVLDTRDAEPFARFHIPGAIQIGLKGPFASWAALLLEPAQSLLLIAEDAHCAQEALNRLARVGFTKVVGFALADKEDWQQHGIRTVNVHVHRCRDVYGDLQASHLFQLIDVRSPAEWLKGHLPGAVSLPLLELKSRATSIDLSKPSLVYCHEGYRAATAASVFLRDSACEVGILIDGTQGWRDCGLALETVCAAHMHPPLDSAPKRSIDSHK